MRQNRKRRRLLKHGLAAFLVASLLLSSGCALLWLGAYLIRMGEEGGDAKRKDSSESSTGAKTTHY
jgi:hypothetical protein